MTSYKQKLYGLDKKGSYKEWNIAVLPCADLEGQWVIEVTYGKEGGAMTPQYTSIKAGKQGRSVYEQAVSEAKSKVSKQYDKGYRATKEELENLPIMAMLAKPMNPAKYKAGFASPKLDGVRCLAKMTNGEVTLSSRMGKPYNVPHVTKALEAMMFEGEVWDGELYVHGYALEDINSAVKREDAFEVADRTDAEEDIYIAELRAGLQFHVFDILSEARMDAPFSERYDNLREVRAHEESGPTVLFVDYDFCATFDSFKRAHDRDRQNGYEGVMWRDPEGVYESGKRSSGLQKYKEFFDTEMEIIDYTVDKNGNAMLVVFDHVANEPLEVGYGDFDQRRDQVDNFHMYRGKFLTVQIQSRFKKTLRAQFPSGKLIRAGKLVGGVFIPEE